MKSISLTAPNGQKLKIEIEELYDDGDGYFYFNGKTQEGEFMRFRIKHGYAEHLMDKVGE